jgi:hypothetical protein
MSIIRTKDDQFIQLQKLIREKEQMLLNKQTTFRNMSIQNHYLNTVKQDYSNYYGHIVKQHKDQILALELLDNYIKDLITSGKLTENNIEDGKQEQTHILKEIRHIKKKIDSMIDDDNNHNHNNK